MANELRVSLGVVYANGNLADTVASATDNITQTTLMYHGSLVSVGTSEEDLSVGDITASNGCHVFLKNCDAANFVKYGPKSGGAMVEFGRLYATQRAWFFLAPSIVLRWLSDTAACKVLVKAYER